MEYPTFRLSGVMRESDGGDFEGPLTLILALLSKNKIEIKDIRISEILDQYLAYLDEMSSMDMEIATEFVAMASHLVYIKSRMLLDTPEEIEELGELISSLEALRAKQIAGGLSAVYDTLFDMYKSGAGLIPKQPEALPSSGEYRYSHDKEDILRAMLAVLAETDDKTANKLPNIPIPERTIYPVSDKSAEIIRNLDSFGRMRLADIFSKCSSRSEIVAAFIAILELCKNGSVYVSAEESDDLMLARQ